MNRTQFIQILFEELNKLGPAVSDKLHVSVDASKLWDGKFERSLLATKKQSNGNHLHQLQVFLSFGAIRIDFGTDDKDDLSNLTFSYHIPEVHRWFQPLYRNRIERGSWDRKHFQDEFKLRKHIVSKFNSMIDGVNEWYKGASINIDFFNTATPTIPPHNISYETATFYLMGAIGRVRLCAELHKQRCAKLGLNTNADRIAMLTNELLKEMQYELDSNTVFEGQFINESY